MLQSAPTLLRHASVPGAPLADVCTAVIFCGGRGTRLHGHTRGMPKALVRLGGRTYLDGLLGTLRQAGIRRVVLCVSDFTRTICTHAGEGRAYGMQISYSGDSGRVENGGALWAALPRVGTPLMLCINGDTLVDLDVGGFLNAHDVSGATASLVASVRGDQPHPGAVEVAGGGWVRDIHEEAQDAGGAVMLRRTSRGFANSGVYAVQTELLRADWAPAARTGKLEKRLLRNLAWRGELWAYDNRDRYLLDLGVPDRLERARTELGIIRGFFNL